MLGQVRRMVLDALRFICWGDYEMREYLTQLTVPCVVIAGDKDGITSAQAIKELAVEMQLSRCHLITDAGHLSYVDQPEQFNDIVLSAH